MIDTRFSFTTRNSRRCGSGSGCEASDVAVDLEGAGAACVRSMRAPVHKQHHVAKSSAAYTSCKVGQERLTGEMRAPEWPAKGCECDVAHRLHRLCGRRHALSDLDVA